VIARSSAAGAHTSIGTVEKGETGGTASHLEIFYLLQPGGGSIRVSVNKEQVETVTTASETTHSGFFDVRAPSPGRNNFEISASNGPVILFGAALENDGPGVVYDSLGVNGAYGGLLATAMDEQHWSEQLRHRNPALVILNYGTNESQYGGEDQIKRYEEQLREVVRRVRQALPDVSILIVAPIDRGQMAAGGKVITKPAIRAIVEMQQRVAAKTGCAFFNTYEAMGGEGTMARWHEAKKPLVRTDLTHPTAEGAEIVGRLISNAILDGYANYKRSH
jgi:lysophospholipase L1-like esterase